MCLVERWTGDLSVASEIVDARVKQVLKLLSVSGMRETALPGKCCISTVYAVQNRGAGTCVDSNACLSLILW